MWKVQNIKHTSAHNLWKLDSKNQTMSGEHSSSDWCGNINGAEDQQRNQPWISVYIHTTKKEAQRKWLLGSKTHPELRTAHFCPHFSSSAQEPTTETPTSWSMMFSGFDRVFSAFQVKSTEKIFSPTFYSFDIQFQLWSLINSKSEFSQYQLELRNRQEISSDPSGSKLPQHFMLELIKYGWIQLYLSLY